MNELVRNKMVRTITVLASCKVNMGFQKMEDTVNIAKSCIQMLLIILEN